MEQDMDLAATAVGVASSRKGVGASMPEVQIHQPDLMGPPPGDNAIDEDSWEQPIWAEDGESPRADHEELGRRHAKHQLSKHSRKRSTFDFLPLRPACERQLHKGFGALGCRCVGACGGRDGR